MTRASIFRLTAVALLLLMGVELFTCELLGIEQCESFGIPSDHQEPGDGDSCICCCPHIVVASVFNLDISSAVVGAVTPADPPKTELTSQPFYHPPRA